MLALLVVAATACGGQEDAASSDGTWVGTITTAGDVTTVVNESGSVWGGTARLVEEVSIGVEAGADEYMFGWISGLFATDTEIYVLDRQALLLRVYDFQGRHLRDIGGQGQGPGEFTRPCSVAGTPDGRIVAVAGGNNRINVYDGEGEPLAPWPLAWPECHRPMVVTAEAVLLLQTYEREHEFAEAMQAHGPDGFIGEPMLVPDLEYEAWTIRARGNEREAIPFAPTIVWGMSPSDAMVVGTSDAYSFELRYRNGGITRIERYWDPPPVIEAEREYWSRYLPLAYGQTEGGQPSEFEWDGRLPPTKAAFAEFLPTYSQQIWVVREGRAETMADCDATTVQDTSRGPRPVRCFEQTWIIDAFDVDGRYLGEVETPEAGRLNFLNSFIRNDTVIAAHEDETGTIMVKRYRLVLPGEE